MIATVRHFGKGKTIDTVKKLVVAKGEEGKKRAQKTFRAVKLFCLMM